MFLCGLALAASLFQAGCRDDGSSNDAAPAFPSTGVGVYTSDPNILAQAVGDLVDDIASSLAENGQGGSLVYTAAVERPKVGRLPLADDAFTRTCTVDDPDDPVKVTVMVDTKRVLTGKIVGGKGKSAFSWTTKFEGTGKSKRVWTRPEPGLIACDDPTSRILLDWGLAENVQGLKLAVDDDRTATRTATSGEGAPIYARKSVVKGKRNTTWSATGDAEDGVDISRTKTVTVDLKRVLTLNNVWGDKVTLDTTLKTKADAPLEATVVRGYAEGAEGLVGTLKTITVAKGTLVARGEATKTTLEASIDALVFEPASTNACVPKAGKVTGHIVGDADSASAEKVGFEVNFSDKTLSGERYVSIKIGDREKTTCEGCILDACDLAL